MAAKRFPETVFKNWNDNFKGGGDRDRAGVGFPMGHGKGLWRRREAVSIATIRAADIEEWLAEHASTPGYRHT